MEPRSWTLNGRRGSRASHRAYGGCVPPRPWWRFWSDGHDWEAHEWWRSDDPSLRERCSRCGLRRTLLWAFPRTWYYDATEKVGVA